MPNLKYSGTLKNAQQDAITATVGANAPLKIYSGAQPASPDVAITSQTLLATLTCNATFAPAAASNGVLTANPITAGVGAAGAANGTVATWFRLQTSGNTPHIDGNVSITGGGGDLQLNNSNIATGQTVSITGLTLTNGQ